MYIRIPCTYFLLLFQCEIIFHSEYFYGTGDTSELNNSSGRWSKVGLFGFVERQKFWNGKWRDIQRLPGTDEEYAFFLPWRSKGNVFLLIHEANPQARLLVIIVFAHVVHVCTSKNKTNFQRKQCTLLARLWVWPCGSLTTPVLYFYLLPYYCNWIKKEKSSFDYEY